MLARRFFIVCLVVMVFGMGLSILVAEASRPSRDFDPETRAACLYEQSPACSEFAQR